VLIPPGQLRTMFFVRPNGVLHVGAHSGQEFDGYHANEFGRVLWVEAQESLIPDLVNKVCGVGDRVFNAVVWSESGVELDFKIANNSQSSSLFEFQDHKDFHPEVSFVSHELVRTVRLDDLIPENEPFNMVNLDIQGAELEALEGLGARLDHVFWVYCEVNRTQLYAGIALVGEIDDFLQSAGFFRVVTVWKSANWGDALYVRRRGPLRDWALSMIGNFYQFSRLNRVLYLGRIGKWLLKRALDRLYVALRRRAVLRKSR